MLERIFPKLKTQVRENENGGIIVETHELGSAEISYSSQFQSMEAVRSFLRKTKIIGKVSLSIGTFGLAAGVSGSFEDINRFINLGQTPIPNYLIDVIQFGYGLSYSGDGINRLRRWNVVNNAIRTFTPK